MLIQWLLLINCNVINKSYNYSFKYMYKYHEILYVGIQRRCIHPNKLFDYILCY